MTFLQSLKEKAERATQGPWVTVSDLPNYAVVNMEKTDGGQWLKRIVVATENHCHPWVGDTYGSSERDAAYIAAAHPGNVLALIAALETATTALDKMSYQYVSSMDGPTGGRKYYARDALEEIDKLLEDKP